MGTRKSGWVPTPDGGVQMQWRSRRLKPPPATPWGKLQAHLRRQVFKGAVTLPLQELLEAAKSDFVFPSGRMSPEATRRGWNTLEEALVGWAAARRWRLILDREADTATFTEKPPPIPKKKLGPQASVKPPADQPSLFAPEDLALSASPVENEERPRSKEWGIWA